MLVLLLKMRGSVNRPGGLGQCRDAGAGPRVLQLLRMRGSCGVAAPGYEHAGENPAGCKPANGSSVGGGNASNLVGSALTPLDCRRVRRTVPGGESGHDLRILSTSPGGV